MTMGMRNQLVVSVAMTLALVALGSAAAQAVQEQTPPASQAPPVSQPLKGIAVRGCLSGSKLTNVEPVAPGTSMPASLGVNGVRAIRGQLKSLNGHQVELIGTVEGVGEGSGILVVDSDKGKLYLGGGDPSLGEDLRRNVPPTFYAHTVRNLAATCTAQPPK
jgi:hypothetical protein